MIDKLIENCKNIKILAFTTNALAVDRAVDYALYAKNSGTNAKVGAINANSSINGATINAGELNLSPADATNGGVITTATQTIAGAKTFNSDLKVKSFLISSLM